MSQLAADITLLQRPGVKYQYILCIEEENKSYKKREERT
jgi:hypothetical protein